MSAKGQTVIVISGLIPKGKTELSGSDDPVRVFSVVSKALQEYEVITLDFRDLRTLSPSFAYEAFGKLFDVFGKPVEGRLRFENDPLGLSQRIVAAISRRKNVVEATRSHG